MAAVFNAPGSLPTSPLPPAGSHTGLHADGPPFDSRWLPVADGHALWLSQHGQPQGLPVLLLHGGPGSGCSPLLRRFFDPARCRLICLDQRGAGASRPAGGTRHNTTADLLADLRHLRQHLGIERWLVAGGSWGAALALAHAADQPEAVAGLLLRASFLAREDDIARFFRRDAAPSDFARQAWDALRAALPAGTHDDALLPAIAEALVAADDAPVFTEAQHQIAASWWAWEQALASDAPPGPTPTGAALDALVSRYLVQAHFLRHGCWLQSPSLLALARSVPAVPTLLLHGSADRVCPPAGALALHQALPHSRLHWVAGAGHDPTHPGMAAAMLDAAKRFADQGHFEPGAGPATPPAQPPCHCA